jgi:very-short-patch-repair endonuclease
VSLAAAGHGVVDTATLRRVGFEERGIQRLVEAGEIERVGRGVYVLVEQRDAWTPLAVVQARCPRAVAVERTAAALWQFDAFDRPSPVLLAAPEVVVPWSSGVRGDGITRSRSLAPDDVTTVLGLRVTTPLCTLADVATRADDDRVERALEWVLRRQPTTLDALESWLAVQPRRVRRALLAIIERRGREHAPTESDAETLFVQLVRAGGLPTPLRQQTVLPSCRVDFLFPDRRGLGLVVEIDGAETHNSQTLQYDLSRQNRIVGAGYDLRRYTWADVHQRPRKTAQALRMALADEAA